MAMRHWLRPPRHVLAIFVAVAIVSACALAWLMWLLLEQDKTVELQRRQERLEQVADRATSMMQAALADLDRASDPPKGVLAVRIEGDRFEVRPTGGLLYFPELPQRPQTSANPFAEGEQAEFARNDPRAAADIYIRLAENKALRAGALTRLARVQRKMKDYEGAIRAYDRLLELPGENVSGLPADLIAREGRAAIFEETHQSSAVRKEAAIFDDDLHSARWRLTKSEYEFYSAEARTWLGRTEDKSETDAIARAEAVGWLWENRHGAEQPARRLIRAGDASALVVSHTTPDGLAAAVVGPEYLARLCGEVVSDSSLQCTLSDAEGRAVVGQLPPSRSVAVRTAAASRLPWTLQIASSANTPEGPAMRPLLLWVAAVLTLVWLTGASFIVRAIRREARVAQLQSDFVAAVSHEFRSPLSALCQISEMLASDRFESAEVRRNAYGVLSRESERLRRMVEALLDFQRFEAGAAVYHFELLEIGAFLKSIVAEFQERAAASDYTVELRLPDQPTYVKADREALSRAIWNLLDNAVKYSPEHRTVWVDVGRTQNRVSIGVQDRGIGIPLTEQRDIFEKFVRGADSKARRIKGTGIGLAMVRHIVQAHGGEIVLTSEPGAGSRFTIVFPEGAAS